MLRQRPNRIFSDSLFITFGDLLNRAKGLIFVPVIIGVAGVAGYGVFVLVLANLTILKPLASLSAGGGFQRFASSLDAKESALLGKHLYTVLALTCLVAGSSALLLVFLAPVLNELFFRLGTDELDLIQLSAAAVISGALFSNMSKFLLARKHFKLCAVLTLGYNLIPYVMFVGGLFVFESLYEGLLCYVAADILIAVAITIWILRKFAPCSPDLKLASRYVKYSAPLALSEIEGGLLSKVDRYTIAFFMDLKFLAVYNVMANVFMMFDALNAPIRKQIMSYLPKPWDAGYREDTISLLRQILLLFCVLVIGLIWCVSLHMEILLGIIMGDVSYVDSLTLTASLLGVAALLSNIRRFFNQLIKLNNRSMHVLVFQLLGLFPSILLNILLVPSYGLVGASVASLISYATIVGTMNYRYSLAIDTDFLKAVGKVVLLASLMSLVYYLVDPHTWLTLILSATLSIGIYAALCAVLLRGLYRPFRESLTRVRDHKY